MAKRYAVVGAGLSGAVVARAFGEAGLNVLVVDERPHVAGNCHTARDAATGVMTHVYGPHIFHTADERVWEYVRRFATMEPYRHRVMAVAGGRAYSMPINLLTINQFFGVALSPAEAREFIAAKVTPVAAPQNFEELALATIGSELYQAFFRGYTLKQWGRSPTELPASILRRLPLRFDYDDSYFSHPHQAIPREGYTRMVEKILDAPNVELRLGVRFETIDEGFEHVIYSGPIDRFFDFKLGRLGYRTLDFETIRAVGDQQGAAVINYCDEDVPYNRITEHKHFAPWEKAEIEGTILYREVSRACGPEDIPFYPIRLVEEQKLLQGYVQLARATSGVSFIGRLGAYRYLDMDQAIGQALGVADAAMAALRTGAVLPAFFVEM